MSVQCTPEMYQLFLRLPLFRGLEENDLAHLLKLAELIEIPTQEYAIREGEQDRNLFILLAGKAGIYKSATVGQKEIQIMSPGECFGEMSLIESRSRSASVKAITHCRLLRIDGDDIIALPEISSKLFRNIAVLLSRRLRHANEILSLG
jgi:CRP/FNR family transcriptional regulator, cyclic AMP receptor protein